VPPFSRVGSKAEMSFQKLVACTTAETGITFCNLETVFFGKHRLNTNLLALQATGEQQGIGLRKESDIAQASQASLSQRRLTKSALSFRNEPLARS
jgi:hypothetical protein